MSIPYLTDGYVTDLMQLVEGQHPVSGVSEIYGAVDRFHFKNHKGEMKVLSDPDCIVELKKLATEYAESMNSVLKMIKKHASQCRSDRHLKLILFITLRYNSRRNLLVMKDRERVTGFQFKLHDEYGWMVPMDNSSSPKEFPTFISKDHFVAGERIPVEKCFQPDKLRGGTNFMLRLPYLEEVQADNINSLLTVFWYVGLFEYIADDNSIPLNIRNLLSMIKKDSYDKFVHVTAVKEMGMTLVSLVSAFMPWLLNSGLVIDSSIPPAGLSVLSLTTALSLTVTLTGDE